MTMQEKEEAQELSQKSSRRWKESSDNNYSDEASEDRDESKRIGKR